MPNDPNAALSGPPTFFIVGAVVIVLFVIVGIIVQAINAAKVIQSGHNPLTLDTDLQLKVLDSAALARDPNASGAGGTSSIESRLKELQDLHARNVITDEELAAARAKVLAD